MSILKIFNDEQIKSEIYEAFSKRFSVRAVVVDSDNNIALIHSNKFNYHEIPGGGVEEGESAEQSVVRECKEEVGCNVEIIKDLGVTLEVNGVNKITNTSYGYLVKVLGEKQNTEHMEEEIEEDFDIMWVPIDQAIELIKSDVLKDNIYHEYIRQRALTFLNEAKKIF